MKSADSRTRSKILPSSGFMKASPWMDSIWPILRAAPRTRHRVETILSAFESERKTEDVPGFFLKKRKKILFLYQVMYRNGQINVHIPVL